MHIGNSIICPVTGIPMLVVAGVTAFYAYKKAKKNFSKDKIFQTVALTAMVFAMQMINFAIPQTSSSGHIIGGVLLAALLSPSVAFLAMCSILLVQAVFFADGGLLALGCNIFNMGVLACFVAYPLFYKPLADKNKPFLGAVAASIIALQLGSLAVVAESALSGSVALSGVGAFAALMQAIHLPIGVAEGFVTGGIVLASKFVDSKKLSCCFAGLAIVLGGLISQFASTKPDGLEWSLLNVSDFVVNQTQSAVYAVSEFVQQKTAILTLLNGSVAAIVGIALVACMMFLVCNNLKAETIKINEK